MAANDTQVGGRHYARGGKFQHWDLISRNHIGYLEGNATKYVTRARHKGTEVQDLEKALHYVDKLLELNAENLYGPSGWALPVDIQEFAAANELTASEELVVHLLCRQWRRVDLRTAREQIELMLHDAKARHAPRTTGLYRKKD